MAKSKGKPITELLIKIKNITIHFFKNFPILFIFIISAIIVIIYLLKLNDEVLSIILGVLITIIAVIIYFRKRNLTETLFLFLYGLLTVFTIYWSPYSPFLFLFIYLGFVTLFFVSSSVKIASQTETILEEATDLIDKNNFKIIYNKLKKELNNKTNYSQLTTVEKAETIRFLSFMHIPLEEIGNSINIIERIIIMYQTDIKTAYAFFRILYPIVKKIDTTRNISVFINTFLFKIFEIPLSPVEIMSLLRKTKRILFSNKLNYNDYSDVIKKSAENGLDEEETIKNLNIAANVFD
ncbi:MAG: hypothetical protein K8R58_11280 [Bacteroidales bacterium]|nr:hypothetical protein [Bacteroidales bacterium]